MAAAAPTKAGAREAMLRALSYMPSKDPLDNRPDTSGHVPPAHYNISPFDQQSYAGGSYGSMLQHLIGFLLHGGGQRQDNQVNDLIRMFRSAGMPPATSNFIAENQVYNPYNRPT